MSNLQRSLCCEPRFSNFFSTPHSTQPALATKPLILAVDDDEDNLLLLAYALEPLGYAFLTAADGVNALSLARTYQPDLILLDVLLPEMDGIEVVSHLKKDPINRKIPVIAVTALAIPEDRERLLLSGFNDYISKPYMLEDIEALVCRYLPLGATIS
jgi:CheY-like chemotaxis protein